MKLFLAPHNDDETLFGAFTILREKPLVVVVTDSYLQEKRLTGIVWTQRRAETKAAMKVLNARCTFLGVADDLPVSEFDNKVRPLLVESMTVEPEMVYAPAPEINGHPHHNLLGAIAGEVFKNVTYYMTYTTAGKSIGIPVPFEKNWPLLKLKALARYESQILEPSTRDHFLREQYEYYYA